ncbi:MAG: hypothetical protein R3176_09500, partial [Woeseiaceae bacterium]|nr:hypothetical protein [Woeseiaceae bacterium]
MSSPPDSSTTTNVRLRRPRVGERTRGAADALQTKIAIGLQNLDRTSYVEQLQTNIADLPEAAGCDAAFVVLFDADGDTFETVLAATTGFVSCNPEVLSGERLADWPWLCER